MKRPDKLNYMDLMFIILSASLFLGCIATTYHTAKTLEPAQVSVSPGYMQARSAEEFGEDPVQLIGFNGRVGVVRRLDLGMEYSWDVTKDSEHEMNTLWGDVKLQLTNKNNEVLKPIFSTGLLKGYNSEYELHFSTLPLILSVPLSERFTPTLTYRYELISETFFPESLEYPRHTFALGFEYDLIQPDPAKWAPKIGFSIGTLNSLSGDPDDVRVIILNFGLKLNSPYKPRTVN